MVRAPVKGATIVFECFSCSGCSGLSKFALFFLLLFLGGICGALFSSGYIGFVLYELVYFLNPMKRWWGNELPGLPYSFMVVAVMIVAYLIRFKHYNLMSPLREQPAFKWMILLLLLYFCLLPVALDPVQHELFSIEYAKLVITLLIAYKLVDSKKAFDAVIWGYLVGAFYIGYLATVTGRNSGDRVEGIGVVDSPDANGVAATLVPAAVLLMYHAWQSGKSVRLITILMAAFIANGIVLINSRGAFLGVVVSLGVFLFYMIFSRYQKSGQRFTAVVMIVMGLSGALYVTDETFWLRMSTMQETEDSRASGASRMVFWWRTFDMLEEQPYGLGVNGYNRLAPIYMSDEERGGVLYRAVHSMWFQGLSEVGYQGFALFILIIWSLLRLSKKAKRYVIGLGDYSAYFKILALECALFGYLMAGTFINQFRAQILYWMFLFLALAIKIYYFQPLAEAAKEDQKNEKDKGAALE